jgi:two-component system CAI-1 autoinducer sensor kinase/phosphatase CqsS
MSKTFLLIDTDRALRAAAAVVLQRQGHIVLEASSGATATAALEMCAPDYIILDGQLPDTDGLRWIERHRALCPGARFIFTAAFWPDMATFQRLQAEVSVALVLPKPFNEAELAERVLTLVRPQRRAAVSPSLPAGGPPGRQPPGGGPARAA